MDRIWLNNKTGKLLLSVKNGMMGRGVMYKHPDWEQIGSVDTKKLKTLLSAAALKSWKGRVKIS